MQGSGDYGTLATLATIDVEVPDDSVKFTLFAPVDDAFPVPLPQGDVLAQVNLSWTCVQLGRLQVAHNSRIREHNS